MLKAVYDMDRPVTLAEDGESHSLRGTVEGEPPGHGSI